MSPTLPDAVHDPWGRQSLIPLGLLVVSALLVGLGLSFALVGNLGAR